MQLYFSPLACTLASRITFYEVGARVTLSEVDTHEQRVLDGGSYLEINPLGMVPALRTDDGQILTENAAVLQYLAEAYPQTELAPREGFARTRLQQWLSFIGTELHKGLFVPLLDERAPAAMKEYVLSKAPKLLSHVDHALAGREFLLDRFSVADAYLTAVLNWSRATPVQLSQWPNAAAYLERMSKRPSVAKALAEELELYLRQQAKRKQA